MQFKKLISVLISGLLLIFLMAGCGEKDEKKVSVEPTVMATTEVKQAVAEKDIVQQVRDSGHNNFFRIMVAKGPEGTKEEHYSDNCIGCHSAKKMLDDKNAVLTDFFPDGKYAGQVEGITCRVCHQFGGAEGISLKKKGWAVCGDCHTSGGKITLGKEVHHPQNEMIQGVGVGEVPNTPSYKCFNMIDFTCYDCHVTNASKHDFLVPGVTVTHEGVMRTSAKIDYEKFEEVLEYEKCRSCHAIPEDVTQAVKKKQEIIVKKTEELKPIYDEWSVKSRELPKDDPRIKTFMEGATYFTYVEADSSKGAHNFELAKALLEKAEAKFSELK